MNKRMVVLGGGISGVGAAVLAKKKGFQVFLSDNGKITDNNKKVLLHNKIDWEEGQHSLGEILHADEVIKSPGISNKIELIKKLNFQNTHSQIIELDAGRAKVLAEELQGTSIINGDTLDGAILREAGVHKTETFVSVTEDDEVNILSALLAKRTGAQHAVALVNIPGFISLVGTLGVDAVINPSQITVSSILEYVRRGRIRDVHPIVEDLGEVLEAEALPSSLLVGKPLRTAKIPKGLAIGGVYRDGNVIAVRGDTIIEAGDTVIIFVARGKVAQVEKLLSVRLDFF